MVGRCSLRVKADRGFSSAVRPFSPFEGSTGQPNHACCTGSLSSLALRVAYGAFVAEYTVALMCRVLGVAPSGYCAWCQRPVSDRAKRDRVLTAHVRAAFKASKGRYGSLRVHAELREEHGIGRKRVARLMRADGLRARPRRSQHGQHQPA